jgi:hypothetical protein
MLVMDGHADQQFTPAANQEFASGRRWAQDRGGDSGETASRINSRGVFNRGYKGEIEIFLIHCADLGQIYAVPVDEAPTCEGYLRVDPTENGQAKGVRWASDYELPG